jgi:hypothetical protein
LKCSLQQELLSLIQDQQQLQLPLGLVHKLLKEKDICENFLYFNRANRVI